MVHSWPLLARSEPRRLAVLTAAPGVILGLLQYLNEEGRRVTQVGLPADATVVAADYDFDRRCFRLLLESEEFEPIVEGAIAPELYVTFTEHREEIA